MPTIELREFRREDAVAVHRWFNDERVTADLVGHRERFGEDEARGWVERAMDTSRDRKWAIVRGEDRVDNEVWGLLPDEFTGWTGHGPS